MRFSLKSERIAALFSDWKYALVKFPGLEDQPAVVTHSLASCFGFEQIHHGCFCFPDLDECLEERSCCEQDCTNYPGGYECYCSAGYRLNSDGCGCDGTLLPCSLLNLRQFCTNT